MLDILKKLFSEQIALSSDLWAAVLIIVTVAAFAVPLLLGLLTGSFKSIKSLMGGAVRNPSAALDKIKKMPSSVKTLYKNARIANIKPSSIVTEDVCVERPYRRSLLSKVWLITLVATLVCSSLAATVIPVAKFPEGAELLVSSAEGAFYAGTVILLLGGLLTLVGGIIGMVAHGSAIKTYEKFALLIDGDTQAAAPQQTAQQPQQAAQPSYAQQQAQQAYAEPEAQPVYAEATAEATAEAYTAEPYNAEPYNAEQYNAEPVQDDFGDGQPYAQPVQDDFESTNEPYAQPRQDDFGGGQTYARPVRDDFGPTNEPVTPPSQPEPQPQPQPQAQQQAAPSTGSASVDEVIAKIDQIDREGGTREAMREVAAQLQKERAKPENRTPELQRKLNEALSKLLKAMSGKK